MKKTYVITGATSGIGKRLVEILSENNTVFAGYRSKDKGDEIAKMSSNVIPFYVDYAKPETIAPAIEFIKSKTEKIDSLINIAGCVVAGPVEATATGNLLAQMLALGEISTLADGKLLIKKSFEIKEINA